MKRIGFISAGRLRDGVSGTPRGWDGGDDYANWYIKNLSATSEKAGLKLFVINDIARTAGRLNGLIVEVEGKAATQLYGARAANISLYIPSDVPVGGGQVNVGLHVEAQGGQSITGDFYGAYIYSAPSATPSGDSAVLRLEANVTVDARMVSWLACVGAKGLYAFDFGPTDATTAWNKDTTINVQAGRIKVRVGSSVRYIALYSS